MRTSSFVRKISAAAIVLAALAAVAAPVMSATSPVVVQSVSVMGSTVQVGVKNTSTAQWSGFVGVRAIVADTPIWSFVPVTLSGGQSMTATAGFAGPVSSVLSVGATSDDGLPF